VDHVLGHVLYGTVKDLRELGAFVSFATSSTTASKG
jgi:hypothetical protein